MTERTLHLKLESTICINCGSHKTHDNETKEIKWISVTAQVPFKCDDCGAEFVVHGTVRHYGN